MAITKNSQIDLNGNEMILDADGDTTITADTDDQIDFKTAGTDRVQINSTGDFLVRQTSADVYDTNTGGTVRQFWGNQFSAQNNTASRVIIGSGSNAGLVGGATLNSGGTRPIVNSYISFGSTNQTAGSEAGMVQFYTSTGGATGVVRARIDSDGLKFGSDTAAANALDDYEEGSFAPTIGSGTVSAASGRYTKIGRLVSFNLFVGNFSDTSGTGAIQIGLPPFTTQSATQSHIVVMTRYFDISHRSITGYLTDNGSIMTLYQNGNGANNWEQLSHDNLSSSSAYVRASGVYYTN